MFMATEVLSNTPTTPKVSMLYRVQRVKKPIQNEQSRLQKSIDIQSSEIRYMAHRFPVMSYAIGRYQNELRGDISI